jgi:hypothetical protein
VASDVSVSASYLEMLREFCIVAWLENPNMLLQRAVFQQEGATPPLTALKCSEMILSLNGELVKQKL